MNEVLLMATTITPLTSGIIQAIKQTKIVNKRYLPAIAPFVGVLLGAGAYFLDAEIGLRLWAGGVSGLAAVGLFELGKNVKGDA